MREARVHAEFSQHVSLSQAFVGLMYRRVGVSHLPVFQLYLVVHAFSPDPREAEAGESL